MTTIADVVSLDRKASATGLYYAKGGVVRPLEGPLEGKKNAAVALARTDGLTEEQKRELGEQNVGIVYVREVPAIAGTYRVISSERCEGVEAFFNTRVVPYIVLNDAQAESIRNMASQLPQPPAAKENAPRGDHGDAAGRPAKDGIGPACWYGYPGC